MAKELDLNKPVADLVAQFPELAQAMAEIGFTEITNPIALNLMGRVVTIPQGAAIKGFDLADVIHQLEVKGFTIAKNVSADSSADRVNLLKSMIQRLNEGESLESVRKDFVAHFSSVSAQEIADAEQQLIQNGTPISEVQQLCDVHSALMHSSVKNEIADIPVGHPVQVMQLENSALSALIASLGEHIKSEDIDDVISGFKKLNAIHSHYGKKEDLMMSILYNHGVTGPSQVMWAVDDEIKLAIRTINKKLSADTFAALKPAMTDVLTRVSEMIFKEENIFLPLTLKFFSQDEWFAVYRDMAEYDLALIDDVPKWSEGETWLATEKAADQPAAENDCLCFPTGELSFQQLQAILKLLPIDITFIDATDKIRFFINEGKTFNRPKLALGNDVFTCHPPKVLPMIRQLLADFKSKKRSRMEVQRFIKGKPTSVQYIAVYDEDSKYVGTVEFVQDFSKPLADFSKK